MLRAGFAALRAVSGVCYPEYACVHASKLVMQNVEHVYCTGTGDHNYVVIIVCLEGGRLSVPPPSL